MLSLFRFLCIATWFLPVCVQAQEIITLYDGQAPGSEEWTWSEQVSTDNPFRTEVVYNVAQPTLTAYLPPKETANGTAVIVAPGGAFHILSINSEGKEVARWLNSKGVAAFVLKYRLVRSMTNDPVGELMEKMSDFETLDQVNAPIIELATQDGLTAMQYVREHAGDMNIDPQRIGFMGFSAGGTLTMSVVYNADDENRPNFVAPIYAYEPGIIGAKVPEAKTPIFLTVAGNDQLDMMPYSINIYRKWFEAGQPAELHIYEQGGHGFGMRRNGLPTDTWYERLGDWMTLQGLIPAPGGEQDLTITDDTLRIPEPELELIFEATVTLDPPREVGLTKYGKRRIIGINGGTFEGPDIKGVVLPGGADWQTVRADGTADLVAKYSLQTDDGVIIFIENTGIRTAPPEILARLARGEDVPASDYYMRTSATFEVDKDSKYAWLNKSVVISTGMRKANSVVLRFYKVL